MEKVKASCVYSNMDFLAHEEIENDSWFLLMLAVYIVWSPSINMVMHVVPSPPQSSIETRNNASREYLFDQSLYKAEILQELDFIPADPFWLNDYASELMTESSLVF
jgi:hypothetical protein